MKISILLLLVLGCANFASMAYTPYTGQVSGPADTLFFLGGGTAAASIADITATKVFYTSLDNNVIFEVDRKHLERIVYANGKTEIFNMPVFRMISEEDWRQVHLTEDPGEIDGLYEKGPVEVTAAASRNRRSTVRNAENRLRREAAILGAAIVLVTDTEFRGGYGDVPSITIRGMAYSGEPGQHVNVK
jgi:hypothetical protein